MKFFILYILLLFTLLSCTQFSYNNPRDPLEENCYSPVNLNASRGTFNYIKVSWDRMDLASQYILTRYCEGENEKTFRIPGDGNTHYLDYDVTAGKSYTYCIKALLSTGVETAVSKETAGYRNKPEPKLSVRFGEHNTASYRYHEYTYDLGKQSAEGKIAGFLIDLDNIYPGLDLRYKAYFSTLGRLGWVNSGAYIMALDPNCFIEAFEIEAAGEKAASYNVFYQAETEKGPTDICKNGEFCGTKGKSALITSFKVWVEKK